MEKDSKIYIAGHTGMVGSAITRRLQGKGYTNIIGRTLEELDLTSQQAVANFFATEKPEYVVLAAAKVGGILANNVYRAQFIYENLMIEANIIHQAYVHGVKKLLFLGSSCIYPKNAPQPLKEEYLLTGELEQTNEPYAIAKIAGIKLCESYYRQYGCNFISVMPTNLYGPNDNYNLETSHVLPAIIRKMHLARCLETANWEAIRKDLNQRPIEGINGNSSEPEILAVLNKYGITIDPSVTRHASRVTPDQSRVTPDQLRVSLSLWGTGQVFREFLHVDDMASACVKVLEEIDVATLVTRHVSRVTVDASRVTVDASRVTVDASRVTVDASRVTVNSSRVTTNSSPVTFLNIGTGIDQTITELAALIKSVTGFTGEILWDHSKPDGTYKKLLDVSILKGLGWNPDYSLRGGIEAVYRQYITSQEN